ncbi:MAG: MATE family efflux transporter [Agathobacter sp.]|nr:MATE family efflux transporter [Agathobacter sp.]
MEQNTVRENKMGVMQEGKLLLNMSLPMMVSMLVQAMYNIVDSIFVSKISEDALTAVSLAFPLQSLMIAVGAGTGVGVNALISRGLGEKRRDHVDAVAANGIFVYALSYIVVAILGFSVVKPFYNMQIGSGQENIMELGVEYLSIAMIFSFGLFAQFVFERILQATGRTFFTMISQMTGAVINIIMDPILIFGLLGFPKLGIAGAAIATVMGQIIASIIACVYNLKKNTDVTISFKGFRLEGRIIKEIYIIGLPSIIMESIGSVMTTGMNLILMGISSTAAAVFGVYFKLQSFFFMPVFGLNNGLIPILSYNYGARNKKRMINTLKYGYMIAFLFMLVGFAAFMLIPDKLLLLFEASETMLAIGVPALRTIAFHFLIAWFCIVSGTLFQAVGNAVYSMYVSVARQLVVLLPVAYVLAKIGGLSLIWWCFPIAELMSLLISVVCLKATAKKKLADFD